MREVGLHLLPVCEVWNGPPCCVSFGPDKPHAGHPGQPYVARHCQLAALTPTGKQKNIFVKSDLLCWSVNGQIWPDTVCGAVATRSVPAGKGKGSRG